MSLNPTDVLNTVHELFPEDDKPTIVLPVGGDPHSPSSYICWHHNSEDIIYATDGFKVNKARIIETREPYTKKIPAPLSLSIIKRTDEAIYLRLPPQLQIEIGGGCSCPYCKAHRDITPTWDTLGVPITNHGHSWRLHMPDPQA